ncbi:MAG: transporter substrate-binding domain-containing protein, partial [Gemmiger sp.]|nr:transporter substrate-binding domain-containing protein [Gemmiger sp.]
MTMKNAEPKLARLAKAAVVALLFFLLSFLTAPACAAAARETVRVGIFPLGQFMGWDENGKACGYAVDYLEKIAEFTHWKYEYVDCQNWETGKDMLEAGQLDLLAPAQRTEKLLERFDFSSISMGIEAAAIYTNADREDLLYEDFDTLGGIQYGIPANTSFASGFLQDYCPAHGLSPTVAEYSNTTALLEALEARQVDAIVTNILFASDEVKLLGWFSPVQVYFIAQKGNSTLLSPLNNALTTLMVREPNFMSQLESKYFPLFSNTQFTYEEQQYIKSLPTVTVGYEVNHAPLSDQDKKTGEFVGVTRDI